MKYFAPSLILWLAVVVLAFEIAGCSTATSSLTADPTINPKLDDGASLRALCESPSIGTMCLDDGQPGDNGPKCFCKVTHKTEGSGVIQAAALIELRSQNRNNWDMGHALVVKLAGRWIPVHRVLVPADPYNWSGNILGLHTVDWVPGGHREIVVQSMGSDGLYPSEWGTSGSLTVCEPGKQRCWSAEVSTSVFGDRETLDITIAENHTITVTSRGRVNGDGPERYALFGEDVLGSWPLETWLKRSEVTVFPLLREFTP